jgi:hypothetical protein
LARPDHRQDAVGIYTALSISDVGPQPHLFNLGIIEKVTRIGKGRNPFPIPQPRIQTDMIGVEMGAHHIVHILRPYPGGSQILEPFPAAFASTQGLFITEAGIDDHRTAWRVHQIGVETEQDRLGCGVVEIGNQPIRIFLERLNRRAGKSPRRIERLQHIDDLGNGDIAEFPGNRIGGPGVGGPDMKGKSCHRNGCAT